MPPYTHHASTVRLSAPPVLEVVRHRALDLLLSGAPLHGALAQLVAADAVLTGLVLRLVRCPLYDGANDRGLSPADALQRVGRMALTHAVTHLPGLPEHGQRAPVEEACRDWVHGLAVAAAARWLAGTGEHDDPDEAYLAGLLHDIGGRGAGADGDAGRCAAWLAERWHLDPSVSAVLVWHEEASRREPALDTRFATADEVRRVHRVRRIVQRADELVVALGHSRRTAEPSRETTALAEAAAESVHLELLHAAALVGIDYAGPEDLVRVLTNEEVRLGEHEVALPPLGADAARLSEAHRRIFALRRVRNVGEILARGLLAIREGLDLDRVVLLEPHPQEPFRLRGRAVSDPSDLNYAGGVHGLNLELDGAGVLQQALERGRAVLGECDERDRLVKQQLGVESFAGAVVMAGRKPMGLVLADRFFAGESVRSDDVRHLELMCDTLGLVLDAAVTYEESRKLRTLAEKDELTGINNRRAIVHVLGSEMERARRFDKPLSVALMDVDHFKRWNDVHGHHVGDMVLQVLAQLIAACSREIDHYGRYGGEEFLVVLPETPVQHAVLYAERLRMTLEGHCAEQFTAYSETPLTVSIGIAAMEGPEDTIDKLVRRADKALYAAKEHGRNRVCVEARVAVPGHDAELV